MHAFRRGRIETAPRNKLFWLCCEVPPRSSAGATATKGQRPAPAVTGQRPETMPVRYRAAGTQRATATGLWYDPALNHTAPTSTTSIDRPDGFYEARAQQAMSRIKLMRQRNGTHLTHAMDSRNTPEARRVSRPVNPLQCPTNQLSPTRDVLAKRAGVRRTQSAPARSTRVGAGPDKNKQILALDKVERAR